MTRTTEKGTKARPVEIPIAISQPSAEAVVHGSSDDLPLENFSWFSTYWWHFLNFPFLTSQIAVNTPSQNLVYLALPNFESVLC